MSTHTQCTLIKGSQRYTCWLPSKYAIVNNYVKIKDEDGWLVFSVGDTQLDSKYVEERSRDYRTQREGSDI